MPQFDPLDELDRIETQEAALNLGNARSLTDPEKAAFAIRAGHQLGLPMETVLRETPAVQRILAQEEAAAALSSAPRTRSWLGDPDNAAVAQDQVTPLTQLERGIRDIFKAPADRAFISGAVGSVGQGVGGIGELGQALDRTQRRARGLNPIRPGSDFGIRSIGPWQGNQPEAEHDFFGIRIKKGDQVFDALWNAVANLPTLFRAADEAGEAVEASAQRIGPSPEERNLWTDINSALGQVLVQVAMTKGMGAPTAGAMMAGQGAEDMADRAEAVGMGNTAEADAAMVVNATSNAILERLGIGRLLDRVPPAGRRQLLRAVQDVAIAATVEGTTEATQAVASNLIERALLNPDAPILQGVVDEGLAGGGAGGILRAVILAAVPGRTFAARSAMAGEAQAKADALRDVAEQVSSSPLVKRAPERLEQLMNTIADGGEVFVPASAVRTFLQDLPEDRQQELIEFWGIEDQLEPALTADADVVMPAGTYLARVATSEAHEAFADHVRFGIDDMSVAEARAFEEEKSALIAEEGERLLRQAQDEEAAEGPSTRVYRDLFRQAREAGFTIDVAKRYAAVLAARYETRGARLGVDAWDAYQRTGLVIKQAVPEQLRRRVDRLDVIVDALRAGRRPDQKRGPSLLEFIARQGGINDEGGELAARDADKWHKGKPGRRKIVRQDGRTMGDMAVAAWEAGYFPEAVENPSGPELLEAIEGELRGSARFAVPTDERRAEVAQAVDQLDELLATLGIDPDRASNEEIKQAIQAYSDQPEGRSFEQFAGRRSFTADRAKLARAEEMEAAGELPGIIEDFTGWRRGDDGQWRYEITDEDAALREDGWAELERRAGDDGPKGTVHLGEVISHDRLFAAYPKLRAYPIRVMAFKSRGTHAAWGDGEIALAKRLVESGDREKALSSLLHEIQHVIQSDEGFALGAPSSVSAMRESTYADALQEEIARLEDLGFDGEREMVEMTAARNVYHRSAGEIEARNTQARRKMTEAQRGDLPGDYTRDVPRAEAVVRLRLQRDRVGELLTIPAEHTALGPDEPSPEQIEAVLEAADQPGHSYAKATLGPVPGWLVEAAREAGVELEGYHASIDTPAVRHIKAGHGNAKSEEKRGQEAVTPADFHAIPDIVAAPDRVVLGAKTKRNQDIVVFGKDIGNGTTVFLAEVRTGRRELASLSMWKSRTPTNAIRLAATIRRYVRDAGATDLKIVEAPPHAKAQAFERWFAGSKVVDARGRPLVMYHGTSRDFDAFSIAEGDGAYFTSAADYAEEYANVRAAAAVPQSMDETQPVGARLMPVHLALKNPLEVDPADREALERYTDRGFDRRELIAKGYDGIVVRYPDGEVEAQAFFPEQVKSTFNRGTYDGSDPRILYQAAANGSPGLLDEFSGEATVMRPDVRLDDRSAADVSAATDAEQQALAVSLAPNLGELAHLAADIGGIDPDEAVRVGEANAGPALASALRAISERVGNGQSLNEAVEGYAAAARALSERKQDPITLRLEHLTRAALAEAVGPRLRQVDAPALRFDQSSLRPAGEFSQRLSAAVTAKYPDVQLTLTDNGRIATLSRIEVPDAARGEGMGSDIMAMLTQAADDAGVALALTPSGAFGGNVRRLRAFYKRFGFVENKGRNRAFTISEAMYRPAPGTVYQQSARGDVTFTAGRAVIQLFQGRDLSTLLHEASHVWLEELAFDAADPAASIQVRRDFQAVLNWFGVSSWSEVTTEHHERWARAGEAYFMEGRAPRADLQEHFQRFKAWLVRIYRTVLNLNVELNDDVRGIFDRLLASETEIAAAKEAQALRPFFASAQDAGMTDAEYAAYQRAVEDADRRATERLAAKAMNDVRRRRTKEWRVEWEALREEVASELESTPEHRAWAMLETRAISVSRKDVVDLFGTEAVVERLPRGVPPYFVNSGGAHPDYLADAAGFPSATAAIEAVMSMEQERREMRASGDNRNIRAARIDAETDRRMVDRHGEMLSDGSIEEEALAEVNDVRRADILNNEVRALARQAGREDGTWTRAALEMWAQHQVAGTAVEDVRSSVYLRTERRAGLDAQRALLKGDKTKALEHKFKQLLNLHLYRAAKAAEGDVATAFKLMSRLASKQTLATMEQSYLDQIHGLLERLDFRTRTKKALAEREALAKWVADQQAAGNTVVVAPELLADAQLKHYTKLTVEEVRGLYDTIRSIAHLGREQKRLLVAGEQAALDAVLTEMENRADALPSRPLTNKVILEKRGLAEADAMLLKMEEMADWLDAEDPNGVFNKVLVRGATDAANRFDVLRNKVVEELRKQYDGISKEDRKRWRQKVVVPELINVHTGEPMDFTRADLVAVALNAGNEGNLDKLARGYNWLPDAVLKVLNRELTASDWQFVQGVWDTLETLWPEIAETERRLSGVAPERVEPMELDTPHGKFRGGYYPVVYDPLRSQKANENAAKEAESMFGYITHVATPKGHTKERTDFAAPILLDLEAVLSGHINKVIKRIAYGEFALSAMRFIRNKRVRDVIVSKLGPEYYDQFPKWLTRQVNDSLVDLRGAAWFSRFIRKARTNATIVAMGFRVTTGLAQTAGLASSAGVIGAKWVGVGSAELARLRGDADGFVFSRSQELANRREQLNVDVRDALRSLQGRDDPFAKMQRAAFWHIGWIDMYAVAMPTWLGGYRKALSQGMEERDAVAFADKAVRASQGSGRAKDLAAFQDQSNELTKLYAMFYSYFNVQYQRQRTVARSVVRIGRGQGKRPDFERVFAQTFWVLMVGPVLGAALTGDWPEEDESIIEWMFRKMFWNLFAGVPIIRDAAGFTERQLVGKFATFGQTPINRAFEAGEAVVRDVLKLVEGEEADKAPKHTIEAGGYVLGYPGGQLGVTTQYLWDIMDGDQQPETPLEFLHGVIKGPQDYQEG